MKAISRSPLMRFSNIWKSPKTTPPPKDHGGVRAQLSSKRGVAKLPLQLPVNSISQMETSSRSFNSLLISVNTPTYDKPCTAHRATLRLHKMQQKVLLCSSRGISSRSSSISRSNHPQLRPPHPLIILTCYPRSSTGPKPSCGTHVEATKKREAFEDALTLFVVGGKRFPRNFQSAGAVGRRNTAEPHVRLRLGALAIDTGVGRKAQGRQRRVQSPFSSTRACRARPRTQSWRPRRQSGSMVRW